VDANKLLEMQNTIVILLAKTITESWDLAVINIEIDVVDGQRNEDCLALLYSLHIDGWKRKGFDFPYDGYDLFVNLRDLMKKPEAEDWTISTLEISSSGKYRFSFSYAPPPRLNGIFDDNAMLNTFVPQPI